MFTIIIKGKKQRNRLLQKMRKSKFVCEEKELLGCKYDLITCQTDNIPWLKISKYIRLTSPIILQNNSDAIDGIKLFKSDKLLKQVFMNTVMRYIKAHPANMLTFVDYNYEYFNFIKTLTRYCRQIRVITNEVEQYKEFAFDLLKNTGASLMISEDIKASVGSEVVVIPVNINSKIAYPSNIKVFTLSKLNVIGGDVVWAKAISYPNVMLEDVPNGVDKDVFFSAIYEFTQSEKLGNLCLER